MDDIVEVIRDGEIVRMSESRALEEDLFILRKVIEPAKEPVRDSTPPALRMSKDEVRSYSRLEKWRAGKTKFSGNNVVNELVENFHWKISKVRRGKGLSRKQLADTLEISEEEMKAIEFGELPSDDFILINRIEEKLGLILRKEKKPEGVTLSELQKMNENKVREEIEKSHRKDENSISGEDIELVD